MVERTSHDFLKFYFEGFNCADIRSPVIAAHAVHVEFAFSNMGNIFVFKIKTSLGMFNNGRRIRGDEELDRLWAILGRKGTGLTSDKFGAWDSWWNKETVALTRLADVTGD